MLSAASWGGGVRAPFVAERAEGLREDRSGSRGRHRATVSSAGCPGSRRLAELVATMMPSVSA